MNPTIKNQCSDPQLRTQAEVQLEHASTEHAPERPVEDLLYELQVHQIELEIQNEALRLAKNDLEDARDRYVDLYDFAPVGYLTLTPEGMISEINLTGSVLLGMERNHLLHRHFSTFVAAEDQAHWSRHFLSDTQGKIDLVLQRGNGTTFYALLDCAHAKGSTAGVRIALSDISERRRQDVFLKARILQTAIFKSAFFSCIATDTKGIIQIYNVGAEHLLGYAAADVMNTMTPADLCDPHELQALAATLSSEHSASLAPDFESLVFKAKHGIEDIYELTHIRKDGSRIPLAVSVTALHDGQDFFIGYLFIGTDNSSRKEIEAERALFNQTLLDKNVELEKARIEADKANFAKSEFLSSMSHELRTPLSAILGFAQLIESGTTPLTSSQKKSIDQILKAGWYLLTLINEILDLALVESGKLSISLKPESLGEILSECEVMIEPLAEKHGISLLISKFETPCFVQVDQIRMKQVFINLLSNAVKYNTTGGSIEVDIIARTRERIRIGVRDTGAGLDQEQIAELFQPFNRLGQKSVAIEGTGIGLVVSKRLVEMMGGLIGVESTVGEGSQFWIELNLAGPCPDTAFYADKTPPLETGVMGDSPPYTLLCVEDNPANLMLVEQLIAQRPDIQLLTAIDGKRGIELAQTCLPDIIVMDINLPDISGIDALIILARDPATAHIPVIALSANAMSDDIRGGLDAGFFRYFTKPIRVNEFMASLDAVLKLATKQESTNMKKRITPNND